MRNYLYIDQIYIIELPPSPIVNKIVLVESEKSLFVRYLGFSDPNSQMSYAIKQLPNEATFEEFLEYIFTTNLQGI
jgi:hypothetical protein